MYILTKSALALMIGFIISTIMGYFLIPLLKKLNAGQRISVFVGESHKKKNGIPTIGGLIFIIPAFITIMIMYITKKININSNLLIVLFVFVAYAILGFIDDFLKIKRKKNEGGLTEIQKLFGQVLIAIVFFFIYMKSGSEPLLWFHAFNLKVDIGWLYGFFILFMLVASSNAVNITDGLDGLAGGLSFIATFVLGIITWNTKWLAGFEDIAIFCFILDGCLLGFLVYNTYPAKVFMGDTGSLALGGAIAGIALYLKMPLLLIIIALVPIIETVSVMMQVAYYKKTGKRIFKMAPIHHHFELCGWKEGKVVSVFSIITLILCIIGISVI